MDVARRPYGTAKSGRDFVIAQVDVSTARRANCRGSRAAYFLFSMTIKTLDDTGAFAFPQRIKPLH